MTDSTPRRKITSPNGKTEKAWASLRPVLDEALASALLLLQCEQLRFVHELGRRAVEADEALRIGLVDRVVPSGTALEATTELATLIAGHPQTCALSDRASAIASWDLPLDEAMAFETAAGRAILTGPEIAAGVGRFVSGDGRHGASRSG